MKNIAVIRVGAAAVVMCFGCGMSTPSIVGDVEADLDSLSARVVEAHQTRDPVALARLHTDSVVFEWQGAGTSVGRSDFEARMRRNWSRRQQLDLNLQRAYRRVSGDLATEIVHYRETWRESQDTLTAEYGRYAAFMARQPNGEWLIDRLIGFTDSVVESYGGR